MKTKLLHIAMLAMPAIALCDDNWSLTEVVQQALQQRAEIAAAAANVRAAQQRPAQMSAWEDPMLTPSIDHYPFERMSSEDDMNAPEVYGRYDWSIGIEQRFPLSDVLTQRRDAAQADVRKTQALAERTAVDVAFDAARAFFMLLEKRRMTVIIDAQQSSARDIVAAASARYAAGLGAQADVLRAEVEVARLAAQREALVADIRAAEAMLNASIGRAAALPVPALLTPDLPDTVPTADTVRAQALSQRSELRLGDAEIARAQAEIGAMEAMYKPMGMVRLGYASTMAEGRGAMLMFGVSLPIWRDKLRSGVAEAQAMAQMARADRDAMYRMVEADALAALAQLESAQIQFRRLSDDVLPRAQRVVTPTLTAYAAGRGSLIGVIDALQTWRAVEAETVMAHSALGIAWAQLQRAMGQALETPR